MQFRYAPDRNFEDFASGRVFYAQAGHPAFPVRLASEIFQRCLEHWQKVGGAGPCTLYDPTCGGAYWLAVLAFLHWDRIGTICASDIHPDAVRMAEKNLSLLSPQGLERRINQIKAMLAAYGKNSHAEALESAYRFRKQLSQNLKSHPIHTRVFLADSMEPKPVQQGTAGLEIDVVLADVPYGWHSNWEVSEGDTTGSPMWSMLETLKTVLSAGSVIAIAADKKQKIRHNSYSRLERFQSGKRQVVIMNVK
jgi:hypothetical protein